MKIQDVQNLYQQFVLPTYKQSPVCLVKGKGSRVWDIQGKEYLDFFPGWAVSGLGHCHPAVVNAIRDQAGKILHISNNFYNLKQARLAEAIEKHSFPAQVFFCNSGAEANEAAIKFARKNGNASGRYEIISMTNSFHGRTFAAVTATGQAKYHEGFGPLTPGFVHVPFNDFAALQAKVNDKTIAVLLELIQGEGGINVTTQEYMRKLKKLCQEKNLLLIADEVQTGMGRTGKMFAFQHYGIEPDLMTLAKSLGGGVPIGALVVNNKITGERLSAGTHASTYGGNPLVCAAALAVFKTIEKEKLLENAERMGNLLREKLEALKKKYSFISEVRGMGLMLGMELTEAGSVIADRCRDLGLLINCTQERVLRVMPAINVSAKLIDKAVKILDQALSEFKPAETGK